MKRLFLHVCCYILKKNSFFTCLILWNDSYEINFNKFLQIYFSTFFYILNTIGYSRVITWIFYEYLGILISVDISSIKMGFYVSTNLRNIFMLNIKISTIYDLCFNVKPLLYWFEILFLTKNFFNKEIFVLIYNSTYLIRSARVNEYYKVIRQDLNKNVKCN